MEHFLFKKCIFPFYHSSYNIRIYLDNLNIENSENPYTHLT